MLFGGLIGLEREFGNRPAGFRTHTLVCMGSALVMLTSQYVFTVMKEYTYIDPTRLGAQVISGIGFLGAGTIMKEGPSVRGLTTAASLWVVACIGLAIGSGFYFGALAASVFSYITLAILKRIEGSLISDTRKTEIRLYMKSTPGQIAKATQVLNKLHCRIKDIRVAPGDSEWTEVLFHTILPHRMDKAVVVAELLSVDGVSDQIPTEI